MPTLTGVKPSQPTHEPTTYSMPGPSSLILSEMGVVQRIY